MTWKSPFGGLLACWGQDTVWKLLILDSVYDSVRVNVEAFHVTKKIKKVLLVSNHSESENVKDMLCNLVKEQLATRVDIETFTGSALKR